jgi:hypothetical protein
LHVYCMNQDFEMRLDYLCIDTEMRLGYMCFSYCMCTDSVQILIVLDRIYMHWHMQENGVEKEF